MSTKLLILTANARPQYALALDEESHAISERVKPAIAANKLQVVHELAVRGHELSAHLVLHRPDLVHFSGHGRRDGSPVFVEHVRPGASNYRDIDGGSPSGPSASGDADGWIEQLFRTLSHRVRCVVLNACFSARLARRLAKYVDCVIGMEPQILDSAAVAYAGAFYGALALGESVKIAHELALVELSRMGPSGDRAGVPQLYVGEGIDATFVWMTSRVPRDAATPQFAPPCVPPHFRGRAKERELLLDHVTKAHRCGLFDVGGAGKTTLAASVAGEVRTHAGRHVIWLRVGDEADLQLVLESLALSLGARLASIPDHRQRHAYLRRESENKGLLVVFDDVNREEILAALLESVGDGNAVLVTGRDRGLPSVVTAGLHVMHLDPLASDDAASLLIELVGNAESDRDSSAWQQLAAELGTPLAIELVAGQLHNQVRPDPRRFLEGQSSAASAVRAHVLETLVGKTIAALDPDSTRVFLGLGAFAGTRVNVEALAEVCAMPVAMTEEIVSGLIRRMVIRRDGDHALSVHPALRLLARTRLRAMELKEQDPIRRHASYYRGLLRRHGGYEWNIEQYPKLVAHEHEVLHAVRGFLRRCGEGDRSTELAIECVFLVSWYLNWRGYFSLRYELCGDALAHIGRTEIPNGMENQVGNLYVDQGWMELSRGNRQLAEQLGAKARPLLDDRDRPYQRELAAQIELAAGHYEAALDEFQELRRSVRVGSRFWLVLSFRTADALHALRRGEEHDNLVEELLHGPTIAFADVTDVRARLLYRRATRTRMPEPDVTRLLVEAVQLFERAGNVTPDRVECLLALSSRQSPLDRRKTLGDALSHARVLGSMSLIERIEAVLGATG